MNSSEPKEGLSTRKDSGAVVTIPELRIVCIDHTLDEDLMFVATFVRHLERVPDRPPMLLVVGSGESIEHALSRVGVAVRRDRGQIHLATDEQRSVFGRAMREYGRKLVGQLADVGVPSVAFFGMDRALLCVKPDGSVAVSGIDTLTRFIHSGVISILLCGASDSNGRTCDVHPIRVCDSVQRILLDTNYNTLPNIVLTVRKLPESFSGNPEASLTASWSDVKKSGLKLSDELAEFAAAAAHPFSISTVSNVGRVSQIRVGV